ncbi:MAG: PEP-CTERM sorting domain-containing protein [Isosphaeraceae bacterium]
MKSFRMTRRWSAAAILALTFSTSGARADLVTNGGFEFGLSGWTREDQLGSEGSFLLQTGVSSPVNGFPVPAPPEGTRAAMTDAQGPGSHVMYQDIVIPVGATLYYLQFKLHVNNQAGVFFVPGTAGLDFATPALNQQARVDLLRQGAGAFSVAAADVVFNAFRTNVGDTFGNNYFDVIRVVDLTGLGGQTLRLRFAEVDNVAPFNFGVDSVSLSAVPEPSPIALSVIGAGLVVLTRWRASRKSAD